MGGVKRERVLLYAFDASSLTTTKRKKITSEIEKFTRELKDNRYDKTFHKITDDHYLDTNTPIKYNCNKDEVVYLTAWSEFQKIYTKKHGKWDVSRPLYIDDWTTLQEMHDKTHILNRNRKQTKHRFEDLPSWKQGYLRFNAEFYERNADIIKKWLEKYEVKKFPRARRIFEWQAGDEADNLTKCLIQFRQSGIRVKRPNYIPALVAINQTSILGSDISPNGKFRKLTPRECARQQAFPDDYDFSMQGDAATYKQLGNAVNVNVIYWTFRKYTEHFANIIGDLHPELSKVLKIISNAKENPDKIDRR